MTLSCTWLDLYGLVMGSEWSWHAVMRNSKELIRHLDRGEMQLSGHGLRWNATWMEFRCEFMALEWVGTGHGWRRYSYLDRDWAEMGPACRWSLHIYSRLEVWRNLVGDETQISAPGWWWDVTWIEVRCWSRNIEGGQKGHVWNLNNKLMTWMQLIQDRDVGETHT